MKETLQMIGLIIWKNFGVTLSIGVVLLSNFLVTDRLLLQEFQMWVGETMDWSRYLMITVIFLITTLEGWAILSKRGLIRLKEIRNIVNKKDPDYLYTLSEEERNAHLKKIHQLQEKEKGIIEYIELKKTRMEIRVPSLDDRLELGQKEEELKKIEEQIRKLKG